MADVNFILTDAGAAALVNAANNGTDPIIISHCGVSSAALVPSAAATVLTGEIKRISTLSGGIVSPDTIHVIVRDESTDVYSLRSLALYTDDGTLFAIYGQSGVIMQKSSGGILLLTIDAKFVDVDASLISFGDTNFLNPPATESIQGVIEIATQAEATAGADDVRALTPKKARAALLPWLLAQDGAGSGVDADLLDGKQAAAFLELVNFTGAAVLAKLLTVDGAGSGLDADLLDGKEASAFLELVNFTGAAVLAKLLTVDGAGSGIDADLLDGQQGSYYTNIPARLGFPPLNSAAYTAADVLAKLLTVDGAGSGVDADLLDGLHASSFIKTSDFNHLNSASGYVIFPSGLAMQWRRGAAQTSQSTQNVTWPLAFSTIFDVQVTTSIPTNTINHDAWFQVLGTPTLTGCTLVRQASNSEVSGAGTPIIFAYGIIG